MTNWALWSGINYLENAGVNLAASNGTTITAAGTAHTKGGWTQLIAATAMPAAGLMLTWHSTTSNRNSIDIGIGAGGSETVLIPDAICDWANNASNLFIPIAIPAGTRIAARCQSETISATCTVMVDLVPATELSALGYGRVLNLGFNAGTTRGIGLDGGAVANTLSAYVDITTNLAHDVRLLYVLAMLNTAAGASSNLILEFAHWDGAAYQHLFYHYLRVATGSRHCPPAAGPIPVHLKTGSRIGVRISSGNTDVGARTVDLVLLGVG